MGRPPLSRAGAKTYREGAKFFKRAGMALVDFASGSADTGVRLVALRKFEPRDGRVVKVRLGPPA